jgi:hypothetical protein
MTGFAWGGDVVGWVDFSQVKINVIPPEIDGCTDPTALNYDPLATLDDSSCCYAPNTWNATTKQCVPKLCPDGSPVPPNGQCPIDDPDICSNIDGIQSTVADIPAGYAQPEPGSKFCPPTTCVPGKPCDKCWNVGGVQLTVPIQYNAVYPVNQCVIKGCTDSQNTTPPYNPQATVDNGSCPICNANSPAWVEATQSCPICNPTVPGWVDGKCPKQPIKPVYIET